MLARDTLAAFFNTHEFTITPGSLLSAIGTDYDYSVEKLSERIYALSPSQLVVSQYAVTNLSDLPSPFLVICASKNILLVSSHPDNKVQFIDPSGAYSSPIEIEYFIRDHKPETIVSYVGGYIESKDKNDFLLSNFLKFNTSRLARGFIGNLSSNVLALALPIGALLVIDKVLSQNGVGTLDVILIFILLAEVARFFMAMARDKVLQSLGNDFDHESMNLFFHHLLWNSTTRTALTSHDSFALTRASSDLNKTIQKHTALIASDLLFLVILGILLFSLSVKMGLISLVGIIIILLVTLIHAKVRSNLLSKHFSVVDERNNLFSEYLGQLHGFSWMGRESYLWKVWQKKNTQMSNNRQFGRLFTTETEPLNNFFQNLLRAALLWFGAQEVLQQNLTLGQFIAFNLIAILALGPIRKIAAFIEHIGRLRKAQSTVQRTLSIQSDKGYKKTKIVPPNRIGGITINNLRIDFKDKTIFNNASLKISEGEKIAIVGHSGIGKSTLLQAILGIIKPVAGQVKYHSIDLETISKSLYRKGFGVLQQSPHYLPGTLYQNLTFDEESVETDEIWLSLETACIADLISTLPDRLETHMEDLVLQISRGQLQRLCLARAFIHGSNGLILDEPTSALDSDTEKKISDNIFREFQNRTIVVATHSEQLARRFDRVLTIEQGQIVASDISDRKVVSQMHL